MVQFRKRYSPVELILLSIFIAPAMTSIIDYEQAVFVIVFVDEITQELPNLDSCRPNMVLFDLAFLHGKFERSL